MALTICNHRDETCPHCQGQCPDFVEKGRCAPCDRHYQHTHANRHGSKGNTQRWRRFRLRYLAEHPTCECGEPATEIDHLDGTGRAGPNAYVLENLQAMCKPCHSRKTATQDGGFGRYG